MSITDIIRPEIKDDEFYHLIVRTGSTMPLRHILEIGSSSGGGSTEAWVKGILANPYRPVLHCLEVSRPRFEKLRATYAEHEQVRCHWASSVPVERFPKEAEIRTFYETEQSVLHRWPLDEVLSWLKQDIDYLKDCGAPGDGIRTIKEQEGIRFFDAVLIDGSEFLGGAELEEVYGATLLLLDDIRAYKNFYPFRRLSGDPDYRLIYQNDHLRNGFAVFQLHTSVHSPSLNHETVQRAPLP